MPVTEVIATAEETGTTYPYFNHRAYVAQGAWSRRTFVGKWRRLGTRDPLWKPPHPATLRRTLGELKPTCIWLEALPQDPTRGSSFEVPVATAAIRRDPRHPDTGYLTLLHFVNDRDTLHALLENLSERLRPYGIYTLVGPTHLLPQLGGGALSSHWHLPPPADTPYGPPYVPEHLSTLMSPLDTLSLFHFETSRDVSGAVVSLEALNLERLADDLLPLLQTAFSAPALPSPDAAEARAILRWLGPRRPFGFLAALSGTPDTPVGFALLYPDDAFRHRLPPRKTYSRTGRLWGGVLPAFRRQGVGRALLGAVLEAARARGWDSVSVGPVSRNGDADAFLQACGGVQRQGYTLYRTGL